MPSPTTFGVEVARRRLQACVTPPSSVKDLSHVTLVAVPEMSKENSETGLDTGRLDDLRASEYTYLDQHDQVYLDYTGAGLASLTQYQSHRQRLVDGVYGNPHSHNPSSLASTALIEQARVRVLGYFKTSPDEYVAVFTPNATGAARLVGESYPFHVGRRLVLTADNHNSITGLREFAGRARTSVVTVRSQLPDLRVGEEELRTALCRKRRFGLCSKPVEPGTSGLFAYPAQSNFTGVRHPLEWIGIAQKQGYDVLLDAAAYVPTSDLDLSLHMPEFVVLSWYKMFGFPTGLGCLIMKRSAMARLKRPWFSGGTVRAAAVGVRWHDMAKDESAFEDGTVNFLSIPDIAVGLNWISSIGMATISARVHELTAELLRRLKAMSHSSGRQMIQIYGPSDMNRRGGTVTFNILDAAGKIVDERLVAAESSAANISLRTGCFCNPGAGEDAFQLQVASLRRLHLVQNPSLDEYLKTLGMQSMGAIRVSFGLASNYRDLDRLTEFLNITYRDRMTSSDGLPERQSC